MSGSQTKPSRMRPRSLFLPSKPSLTPPQPSTPATATVTTTPIIIPSTTSHVSLFLRNLRLLDLDQEEDWPNITALTFSTKDGAGSLKNRIQCVEWALYHLFVLWDEEEARNKLKPFYPPLDQVQSINLRAALLRSLEQAKRNGVLGRDAVIRKTMLDECKGDRFAEVLAVFSSAVLKKLVAERALNSGAQTTISECMALENWGYSGDRTELNTLILAHKASLRSYLTKKNAARDRYRDFGELLSLKERSITRRMEEVKAATSAQDGISQVPNRVKAELRLMLKTNWTGSDGWPESLLYGDMGLRKDGLLTSPFNDVWAGVQSGRLSDLEDQSAGLLQQLDQRVRIQRARIEKWDGFRKKLFGNKPHDSAPQATKSAGSGKGVDLGFTFHQQLRPDVAQPESANESNMPPAPVEYAELLEAMKRELDDIGKPRLPDLSKLAGTSTAYRPTTESTLGQDTSTEPISDLSEWEDEPQEDAYQSSKEPKAITSGKQSGQTSTRASRARRQQSREGQYETDGAEIVTKSWGLSSKKTLAGQPSKLSDPSMHAKFEEHAPTPRNKLPPQTPTRRETSSPNIVLTGPPRSQEDASDEMPPPPHPISPTQAMADQILASMSNASPSPIKKPRHTLSLEERTRMSMTRTKSFDADDVDSSLLMPKTPLAHTKHEASTSTADVEPGEEYEDLIARTRRSMAGFEAAKQKAQLERRRSQRKSKVIQRKDSHLQFPRVDEEDGIGDSSTIMDELADQDDMEAVFRSRPKMRSSPAPSPSRDWGRDHDYE